MKRFMNILFVMMASFYSLHFVTVVAAIQPLKSVTVQIGEEIRHLDPQLATEVGSSQINLNFFMGLYTYDHKTNEPFPALAKSHISNADSSVWTFKIRKDVPWVKLVGGKAVKQRLITAQDVVYSYRRMISPELASEYAYMLYILKNAEAINKGTIKDITKLGVRAIDDETVEITLAGPIPHFIKYLPHHSFTVVPREPIEQHKEAWVKKENIWTSGEFLLKDWVLKDKIIAIKNSLHPDAKEVDLDEISFKFIGTYSPDAVRAFKAGDVDIDFQPPPRSEITELNKMGVLKIARQLGTYFIKINTTRPFLKDPRVRRAIALVVPRDEIVKYVMKTGDIPTDSIVPNSLEGYTPAVFTTLKTDKERIAEAKKLLAEAGYPNGKGLPEMQYLYNTAETHQKIAIVIAKALKKELGINMKPLNQEWKVYLTTQKALDFDFCRAGWVADYGDPMNFLDLFETDAGNNNTGWSNKEYDALIRSAQTEKDVAKRNQLMNQAETILMREVPVVPILNYTTINLVQKYIQGVYPAKFSQHPMKYVKLDQALKTKTFGKK